MEHYGVDHNFKSPEIIEQRKNTFIANYGVDNPFGNKDIQQQIKHTLIRNTGVDNPMKCSKTKEKAKATNLIVRGVEYPPQDPVVKEKTKKTNMERRGVEYSFQDPLVQEKAKATNLIRYGTENPMQNQGIQSKSQKSAYKLKLYTLPSGTQIKLQGYEPWALDELLKTYKEDQIITDRAKVPRIEYKHNDKTHYYFPDIYIPDANLIIEVKSTWTHKCKLDITLAKADATKALGYSFDLWIFDAKGKRVHDSKSCSNHS